MGEGGQFRSHSRQPTLTAAEVHFGVEVKYSFTQLLGSHSGSLKGQIGLKMILSGGKPRPSSLLEWFAATRKV